MASLELMKEAVTRLTREHDQLKAQEEVDKREIANHKKKIKELGFSSMKELGEAIDTKKAAHSANLTELERQLKEAGAL